MKELISIIIPIYNAESTLEKCLKSLIEQTYKNLEIILINDGSTDNSEKICRKFQQLDSRVKLINTTNKGVSSARNMGLDNSKGNYITFIDADDYVCKTMIEDLYNAMYINKDVQIVQCCTIDVDENFKEISRSKIKEDIKLESQDYLREILKEKIINNVCWGKLYKSECIENTRFNENIKINEDLDFLSKVLIKCKNVLIIKKHDYFWVNRKNSVTKQSFGLQWIENIENCKVILENIEKTYPKLQKYCRNKFFKTNLICYKKMLKENMKDKDIEEKLKKNLAKDKNKYLYDPNNRIKDKILLLYMFMR